MRKITNNSKLLFKDLTTEQWREYLFNDTLVRIENPIALNVSPSGGHRVLDASGISHYIPTGWQHLRWQVKPKQPAFSF